jgi:hypothetical protein
MGELIKLPDGGQDKPRDRCGGGALNDGDSCDNLKEIIVRRLRP